MRLTWGTARIHGHDSSRLPLGDRCETVAHASKESSRLLLEAVFIMTAATILRVTFIPPPRTVYAGLRIRVEQQREIWMQIPA